MQLSKQLKILAQGINPSTGELIQNPLINNPEAIRLLFRLSEELASYEEVKPKKRTKLTLEEKKAENILQGRPANSHLPWSSEEKDQLIVEYSKNSNIEYLSKKFERSMSAITIQLERAGLINYQAEAQEVRIVGDFLQVL